MLAEVYRQPGKRLMPSDGCGQTTFRFRLAEDVEAAASEASEWDSGEREERLAALREEEERLGGEL